MPLVYILSDYEENGAEHLRATLDRARILELLNNNWPVPAETSPGTPKPDWRQKEHAEMISEAMVRLKETEPYWEAGRAFDLSTGWGGIQLHIVELE